MITPSLKYKIRDRIWSVADPDESGIIIATVNYEYSTLYRISWGSDHEVSDHFSYEITPDQFGNTN